MKKKQVLRHLFMPPSTLSGRSSSNSPTTIEFKLEGQQMRLNSECSSSDNNGKSMHIKTDSDSQTNGFTHNDECLEQKPYMSIVHNPPYIEKWFTATQVLERVNKKETKRPRNAYSTPVYNSDVHTCRRKTTPLSAGAIQTKQSQDKIDKEDEKNEQINKDEEEEKEEEEEESSEHELIEKLTEVFGKDTFPSPTDDKVSEELKIRRKIKTFMKKEVFEVHRAEKKLQQKAKVERKPKDRQSVKPPPKIEKSKVKAPIQQINAKPKPKKTSKIQSWVAPPKVELKSQDEASSKTSEGKEENKAKMKELPTIDSKPDPTTQTETTVSPQSEHPLSTSVTQDDDQSEIDVKTDEDNTVEQTNQQTNQAVEDVEDNDAEAIKRRRSPVRKRERIVRLRTENELNELPPEPKLDVKKQANWIYGDDKDDTPVETVSPPLHVKFEVSALPTAPDIPEVPVETHVKQTKCHIVSKHLVPVDAKPRWGNKKYDKSYDDERHRAELAERRRKKQMDMYEKLKLRKSGKQSFDDEVKESASFDEYDFLAKYCIFNKTKKDMIQHAFDIVDEEKKGWLNGEDIMVALRIVNSKLTETEEEYLSRIIEMTGYKVTDGADFKLFSVLSALSTRISLLDSWMKNLIGTMDFKTLEMKLFICKTLWECNVDHETNTIPLEQVMIELRAGGVSYKHECQVKKKLSHLKALDLFDFLTYVPLFIMIHEAVVDNPLDESRIK